MSCKLIFSILLNVSCSVGLIFCNKIIFENFSWDFATCLTSVHFFCNYLSCELISSVAGMERKWLSPCKSFCMALFWAGSIVFANLSLLENDTGFYQATKLLTSPILIIWQWAFFGIRTDSRECAALVPLIAGIGLITEADVGHLNVLGAAFAIAQLISAAAVQTWVKRVQVDSKMHATQLLLSNSLICFVLTLPLAPLLDEQITGTWLWDVTDMGNTTLFLVILTSAMLALGMNIACFLIIDLADPLTFQVVGYFKTLIVFIGGSWLFDEGWPPLKILGVSISIIGLILYRNVRTCITREEKAEDQSWQSTRKQTATDADIEDPEGVTEDESTSLLKKSNGRLYTMPAPATGGGHRDAYLSVGSTGGVYSGSNLGVYNAGAYDDEAGAYEDI